ncbi:heme utilization protein [Paramagnetospirillum marisnigri]|uniref:Heme utilization protein n=1 Tax=Paramagnetospirillum marisnigri TaxID=1285242 RepID=A0A178MXD9_9PROT|nr:heme utilization protein [Paramagnetospirillum marisnigri]
MIWTAWTAPLSAATGAATKAGCASTEQVTAAQLRQFHYQLQVAALNCRADDPSLPGKWQSYIQRHAATLSENAGILLRFFKSASAFDRHNTILTNRESVTVHEINGYCEMRAPQFDKAVSLTGSQLATYAAEVVGSPDNIRPCRDPKPQKADAPASAKPKKTASKDD